MDLLLAGYGSSDDEDETRKEDVQASAETRYTRLMLNRYHFILIPPLPNLPSSTLSPKPSSNLFSKLPAPSSSASASSSLFSRLPPPSASTTSSSITKGEDSKGKGKRTVSLMLPISKEALRGKYEDEFMHQSGPALPEAPKPSGLSALLPAPKNPNPAKRQRMATPTAVARRQMEEKSDSSTSTPSSGKGEAAKPAASTPTGNEGQGAPRQPPRSLRAAPSASSSAHHPHQQTAAPSPAPAPAPAPTAEYAAAGSYDAAAYGAYPGYEAYYQYGYQQQGYAQV